ncbi:armadillo-type protein [Limtongia smithiae]|uniref:armadillo-type protein n=1 Tax=Limtongia smithiae TaxID=1125753 RepID=UPI0034CEC202
MESELLGLLEAVQSSSQIVRTSAENQISVLEKAQPNPLATSLIRIGASDGYNVAVRQSALVILRFMILRTWSLQFDEFTGTALALDVKVVIRTELFRILQSKERKLRSLAANLISKISTADFPDEWPELFGDLMGLLQAGHADSILGALSILKELLADGFTFLQFASIASPVFDALYNISVSDQISLDTKAETVDTVRAALSFFNQVDADDSKDLSGFAHHAVDIWSSVFQSIMATAFPDTFRLYDLVLLKHNTVKAMQQLNSVFPSETQPYLVSQLFPAVWSDFEASSTLYVSVCAKAGVDNDLVDPDSQMRFVWLLPLEEMEFLRTAISKHQIQLFFSGSAINLKKIVALCIAMAQISLQSEEDYLDDENSFVAEELSLSSEYTCRTASSELLVDLGEHMLDNVINELSNSVLQLAGQSSWRTLESSMFLLETILVQDRSFGVGLLRGPKMESLWTIVFKNISSESIFLRSRAVILLATLCRNLRDELPNAKLATTSFDAVLQLAKSETSSIVRACCLLSIQRFLSAYPRQGNSATQKAIADVVESMVSEAADETPSLLVDSLQAAIKISPDLAVAKESKILSLLFNCTTKDASNIQLTSDGLEALETLATTISPANYSLLLEDSLPSLMQNLNDTLTDDTLPNITLLVSFLSTLIDNAPSPLPQGVVGYVFPKVVNLLLATDDNQLLQYGCEFVAHITEHDPDQLRNWQNVQGQSGVEVVLNLTAKLLSPSVDESSAMFVGNIVSVVVDKFGRDLGDLLGQLLTATAQRLSLATNPLFVQNLLLVFAHMVSVDAEGVVGFLADVELDSGSGLETVMRAWLANFEVFKGYKEIRLNIGALAKIYMLHDSRVESVIVQGDLIVDETAGVIVTRQRAKSRPLQYTSEPANVKIVKLFIKELSAVSAESDESDLSRGNTALATTKSNEIGETGDHDDTMGEDDNEWEDEFDPAAFGLTMDELKKMARSESHRNGDASDDDIDDLGLFEEKGGDEEANATIINFFKTLCTHERESFQGIVTNYCRDSDRDVLLKWQSTILS